MGQTGPVSIASITRPLRRDSLEFSHPGDQDTDPDALLLGRDQGQLVSNGLVVCAKMHSSVFLMVSTLTCQRGREAVSLFTSLGDMRSWRALAHVRILSRCQTRMAPYATIAHLAQG